MTATDPRAGSAARTATDLKQAPDRLRDPRGPGRGGTSSPGRAPVPTRTLRQDRWWRAPFGTFAVLAGFVLYSGWAALVNRDYYADPYISPFYAPCLTTHCEGDTFPALFTGPAFISPAVYILLVPLGFRLTCYYYRKAYYRSFWLSPPACAVAEPHRRYTGETRFPLIFQNVHRYFFYPVLVFNVILTYDAFAAMEFDGRFGIGLGTIVMLVNAALLWVYSLSCHSCRHVVGGRLNHFSKHPVRYKMWTFVSRLNARHMQIAWASLFFVAFTDLYIRLVASGVISDPKVVF